MIVHKFGGGILKTPEAVQHLLGLLRTAEQPAVVVLSALNKMTNAFEQLVANWRIKADTERMLLQILDYHFNMVSQLCLDPDSAWKRYLEPYFKEIRELLNKEPGSSADRDYDQLVVYGELLSTALIRTYFEEQGFACDYLDARDLVITDSVYRDAGVEWQQSREKILNAMGQSRGIVITQGFIGRASNGDSVTLGREGSDFTAAIFAHCLDAREVWIWKDVAGILNADPMDFSDTFKLDEISYLEAIELAYFGAKVIHPKTIKPLQNKAIPLWVRDFWHPEESGTHIHELDKALVSGPLYILKRDQVLISFQPRDFSFIVEDQLAEIFAHLSRFRIKVNLMQHGAVSFSICVNADMDRINALIQSMLPRFRILYNSGLELVTIRRYHPESIRRMTEGRRILVQQLSRKTARFVLA
ncbi:MAG: aspartate kinase [Bacteroidales bacterium]|nr:aspartate kinase [Bacteroidales bacterium]MDD3811895.1 aspartate kinase [Bacteroidales bacterium]